jgi:hypothetical protein
MSLMMEYPFQLTGNEKLKPYSVFWYSMMVGTEVLEGVPCTVVVASGVVGVGWQAARTVASTRIIVKSIVFLRMLFLLEGHS